MRRYQHPYTSYAHRIQIKCKENKDSKNDIMAQKLEVPVQMFRSDSLHNEGEEKL